MFGPPTACKDERLTNAADAAFARMAERVGSLVSHETARDWALHSWAIAHGLAALSLDGQLAHFGEPPEQLAGRVLGLSAIGDGREADAR